MFRKCLLLACGFLDVVPFTQAAASPNNELTPLPFQGSQCQVHPGHRSRFDPPATGQPLTFFYQIWTNRAHAKTYGDAKITADMLTGDMGLHDTKTIVDEIPKSQFANGSIVNGRK